MRQEILSVNNVDANGNPTGGMVSGTGIQIAWQDGPLGRGDERREPNGAFVDGVIEAAIRRLEFYQMASGGRFACDENAAAIEHLRDAMEVLEARTRDREARAVEGTHTA
jgi:hypothetical protein